MIGIGISPFRRRPPAGGYTAEASALFAKWDELGTSATTARKVQVNNTITALKSAGVWDELDMLYMWTAHSQNAALVDWKNPSTRAATVVGGMTFTADNHFQGNGSTGRINLGYNPGDGGTYKLTQNSTSFGVYIVDRVAANTRDISALTSSTTGCELVVCGATPSIFSINNDTAARTGANFSGTGLIATRRTASNAHTSTSRGYNNASAFTNASQPVQNRVWNAFCRNVGDTTYSTFSNRKQRYLYAGSSSVIPYNINNIIEQYYLNELGLCPVKRMTISGNSFTANGTYVDQLMADINIYSTLDINIRGLSGQGTPQLKADAATNIYPFSKSFLTHNIYFIWELTNDMTINGATYTQAYNNLVSYCQELKSYQPDAYIIVGTMMPRGGIATRQNDANLNDATTLNGLVRLNGDNAWDAVCDTASDLLMGQNGQNTDLTYYNADTIHPNSTGYQRLVTNYIKPSIEAALAL
jgi:lysophospholipase L1-like esterase